MVKKKEKKKINRAKRRRNLTRLLIISVLIYFFIMSIPIIRTSSARTIPIEEDSVVDAVDGKGIILRDEVVYKSQADGHIFFTVEDGEKLSKNTKVSELNNTTYENYKDQLKDIEKQIEGYNTQISSNKKENTQDEIEEITKQREAAIKNKDKIINKMKESNLIYYNNQSGILSRNIDGLEEQFSSKDLNDYKTKDIKFPENTEITVKDKDEINIDDPIFKIIQSQDWFVMTEIKADNLEPLKEGDKAYIKVDQDKEEIKGTIVKLEKSKKSSFIILKLDRALHDNYKKRYIDLQIIKSTYSGFKVPKKSVIEKDGVKGVFIKEISGVVVFKPIKVLKELEEVIVLESMEEDDPLKMFDEVFIDGRSIKEGQIVNS